MGALTAADAYTKTMASKTRFWLILGTTVGLLVVMIWMGVNWMRSEFTGVVDRSRVVIDEGRALGKYVTANGCVDSVFARHAGVRGTSIVRSMTEQFFLEGCLATSQPAAVCDTIPAGQSLKEMFRFGAWSAEQCKVHKMYDRDCPRLLQPLLRYCDGGRRT